MSYYVVQHSYDLGAAINAASGIPPRWHTSEVVDALVDGDFVNAGPFDTLLEAQAAIWPALGIPHRWWPDFARTDDLLPAGTVIRQPHGKTATYLGDHTWEGLTS